MRGKKIKIVCIILGVVCLGAAAYLLIRGTGADIAVQDITIKAGEEIPDLVENVGETKSVTNLMVDASEVDNSVPGTYPITYYYEDSAGNQHTKSVTCTVTGDNGTEAIPEPLATEAATEAEAGKE